MNWLRCLVQNGGSGSKERDMSFAERILHSSLKSGSATPPSEVGRMEISKRGCVLEEFHIKLLMIF